MRRQIVLPCGVPELAALFYICPAPFSAAGGNLRHSYILPPRASVDPRYLSKTMQNRAQRNPLFLFLLSGVFLLRLAARTLFSLLFHEPPRSTLPGVPT